MPMSRSHQTPMRPLQADGLVVPGVGAFGACMSGLHAIGGPDHRRAGLRGEAGARVCVGMQILFARGVEFESRAGAAASGRIGYPAGRPGDPAYGVERC